MAPFSERWTRLLALLYALLVLPLLLVAAILGFAAADSVVDPLASLEEATRRVASGDFGVRLLVKPGDETGRLIASFNRMLSEIERYREGDLRQGKLDAWKDIAQRLAHELKNPLTPIRLAAERLLKVAKTDGAKALSLIEDSMVAIVAEVEGMDALLQDFRAFASLPEPEREWAELRGIVAESVSLYAASYPEVLFTYEGVQEGVTLRADRTQLKRAFANLFANSVEAMEGKGRIEISSDLVKTADSRYCRLRVSDTGPGMSREVLARIFSPYFTTKGTGTGLGLAIVERIVADHGGSIRCESEEGAGASFYIDLPLDH
jgi:nitrogen fixation/metabolism regulation signal transduction histidine kinase